MYKGFLIDLDGTAYLGDDPIIETIEFVKKCKEQGIKTLFLTNNSSKTQKELHSKMVKMGYEINSDEIYTSSLALAKHLKSKSIIDSIYVIGDKGLKQALTSSQIKYHVDLDYEKKEDYKVIQRLKYVIVGYNKKLNYKDLACASIILQKGESLLFATNGDVIIPTNLGRIPGNGSVLQLIENVSSKKGCVVGKPAQTIMQEALGVLGLKESEVCMIGDNYETDILAGINNNIDTVFVETGVTKIEEIKTYKYQPTYKVKNLSEYEIEI